VLVGPPPLERHAEETREQEGGVTTRPVSRSAMFGVESSNGPQSEKEPIAGRSQPRARGGCIGTGRRRQRRRAAKPQRRFGCLRTLAAGGRGCLWSNRRLRFRRTR